MRERPARHARLLTTDHKAPTPTKAPDGTGLWPGEFILTIHNGTVVEMLQVTWG